MRWRRLLLALLPSILLGWGCGARCAAPDTALPARAAWPSLTPYPGAVVTDQRTNAAREQQLVVVAAASKDQVLQYYRSALEPQGWALSTSGGLVEERACPKLFLRIEQLETTAAGTRYRINLNETLCRTYC